MSKVVSLSACLMVSTTLLMTACGNKDKAQSAQNTDIARAIDVNTPKSSDFERLLKTKSRKVSDTEAKQALATLKLTEDTREDLSWGAQKGNNGTYTFEDVSAQDDDETLSIARMVLTGLHMADGEPTYDRLDIEGFALAGSEQNFEIKTLSVARPTPEMARTLIAALHEVSDFDSIELSHDGDLDLGFDALIITQARLDADDTTLNLDTLAWGKNADENTALFQAKGLNLKSQNADTATVEASLTNISITGLDLDTFGPLTRQIRGISGATLLGSFNPYISGFKSYALEDLAFKIDSFTIDIPSAIGKTTVKGDVATTRQAMNGLSIAFTQAPETTDLAGFYDMFTALKYDTIEMSSAQTSVIDTQADTLRITDSYLDMKDGFRFNFDYSAEGIAAMLETRSEPQSALEALEHLTLSDLNMELVDKSILERSFDVVADRQGTSPDQLKQQIKGLLLVAGLTARNDGEAAAISDLSGAIGTFIDGGKTLKFGLKPDTPIKVSELSQIGTGSTNIKALGFYVETQE